MPNHRHYALDEDAKNVLTAIASAVFSKRAADGRTDSEKPNAREEFAQVIQALADAGCNLLQSRPSDPEALPKPWVDEVTGAQLPNPFAKATADLTAQAILMKRDPALAQHLKAMADDPYGTLAKLQDEEAERQALASIPYDDKIHQLNPFLGDNLRAQDEFVKRDRELAKFYKEEARPVEIPLFGKNRNLTLEGRLYRDPHAASVLKVGAALSRQWLESDRQAAGEQRAKAEAEIARLEKQIA
jgi:hypothetical protein